MQLSVPKRQLLAAARRYGNFDERQTMKKQLVVLTTFFILIFNFGCDDDHQNYADQNKFGLISDKLKEFKIPDSVNRSLLIAAYDEPFPQPGRILIVYDDSTRVSVTKICYINDSSVKTEPLIKIRDGEFKSKFSTENYRITLNTVYWSYVSGSLCTSYEYDRIF